MLIRKQRHNRFYTCSANEFHFTNDNTLDIISSLHAMMIASESKIRFTLSFMEALNNNGLLFVIKSKSNPVRSIGFFFGFDDSPLRPTLWISSVYDDPQFSRNIRYNINMYLIKIDSDVVK